MCLNSQHLQYILLTSTRNWNAQEISKHTQTQEIIADLKDKTQKHVPNMNPFLSCPCGLLKGEVKQECLPSREHQHRLYIDIYSKQIFAKEKNCG